MKRDHVIKVRVTAAERAELERRSIVEDTSVAELFRHGADLAPATLTSPAAGIRRGC